MLLAILIKIMFVLIAIDVLIMLPLSLFKGIRRFTSSTIFISSYFFGFVTWFYGIGTAYKLWGLGAVITGLFIWGVGVVPIAMLASCFTGYWGTFALLTGMLVSTLGARIIGFTIAGSAE